MKKIIYILFILPFILNGQDYPRIDTMNFGNNVWLVNSYSKKNDKDEKLLSKYYFNKLGKHTITYSGYNYKYQGKESFTYDSLGSLIATDYKSYTSPKNDEIYNQFNEEVMSIPNFPNDSISRSEWNRIYRKYELLYIKARPESINWEKVLESSRKRIIHNIYGKDSLIEYYSYNSNKMLTLVSLIEFYYNDNNQLEKKVFIDIPQSNVFTFEAFKSNSVEIEDSIRNMGGMKKEIRYNYDTNLVKLDYYLNGTHTGYKKEIWNKIKAEKSILEFNISNDTLSWYKEFYNENGKISKSERLLQKGYNAFGFSMDISITNMKIYKYDKTGILFQIERFEDDSLVGTQRFEIIKH